MRIAASARKHGVKDEDMLHAVRNYLKVIATAGDAELAMIVGPASDGRILEIGVVDDEQDPRIIHAMPARPKFWP